MLLKIILGSISDPNLGKHKCNELNQSMQWRLREQVGDFLLFDFFFPKHNQLCNFALTKEEQEHRNDWRLVFKAGMGFNFGDNDIWNINKPISFGEWKFWYFKRLLCKILAMLIRINAFHDTKLILIICLF